MKYLEILIILAAAIIWILYLYMLQINTTDQDFKAINSAAAHRSVNELFYFILRGNGCS